VTRLHRLHAANQATRVQFDTLGITWRGDGGSVELKTEMAHRLALCWNLCEGFTTETLERGMMRDLPQAVYDGDIDTARRLVSEMDRAVDRSDGRLNDCVQCGAPPVPVVIEPDDDATEPDNGQLEMTL